MHLLQSTRRFHQDPVGVPPDLLRARCCELIHGSALASYGATLFGSLILVGAMRQSISPPVLIAWFAAVCLTLGVRLTLWRKWIQTTERSAAHLRQVQYIYRIGVGVSAVLWGSTAVFLFPPGNLQGQMTMTIVLVGVSAAGMTTLAIDRRCALSFLLFALGPLSLRYLVENDSGTRMEGVLVLIYLAFMLANANRVRRGLIENLRLELEAVQREDRLKHAQQVAHMGSFEWDIASGAMRWSDELHRLWGVPLGSEQTTHRLFVSRIHDDDKERVGAHLDEAIRTVRALDCVHRVRWPDGTELHIQARGELACDKKGRVVRMMGTVQDVSQQHAAEEQIRQLAFFDPLTELPNRHLLLDRLNQTLERANDQMSCGALIFIDLENFKYLNDTLGHDQGDALLRIVAKRINNAVRSVDTVARLGGDEFVVLMDNLHADPAQARAEAASIGGQILSALQVPYSLMGREHHSSSSIGIALFNDSNTGTSVDEMLRRADLAMYQAKNLGRNGLCFFTPELEARAYARAELEADLRKALQRDELLLHFQGQVSADGAWTGAEVLLRWRRPGHGVGLPVDLIKIAEDSGLILPIGKWVLHTACKQLALWGNSPATAHLTLSVNVSIRQFREPDFVEEVVSALRLTKANPSRLKLELTESMLLSDVEQAIVKMTTLRELGVGFALDDFGTGYSCLAFLKKLPLEQLKIDRSFVADVLTDPMDAAIVHLILSLGQSLGLKVVAEGVESEGQRDFLARLGCDGYQGYLFSRPLPIDGFEEHMHDFVGLRQSDLDQLVG